MVSPTNEQIIAEAKRRADFRKWTGAPIEYFIIEVVRENWTPPEPPVDPDVLEFRAWGERRFGADTALAYRLGDCDDIDLAEAYLAGARMAREREQERAKVLAEFVGGVTTLGSNDSISAIVGVARFTLAKYRGEA